MDRTSLRPEPRPDESESAPQVADPVRHGDDDLPAPVDLEDEALEISDADLDDDPRRW